MSKDSSSFTCARVYPLLPDVEGISVSPAAGKKFPQPFVDAAKAHNAYFQSPSFKFLVIQGTSTHATTLIMLNSKNEFVYSGFAFLHEGDVNDPPTGIRTALDSLMRHMKVLLTYEERAAIWESFLAYKRDVLDFSI